MMESEVKLLLLTNKDSDNVGDQVIEACDVSLLHAVMKNLGIENYEINSHSARLVSRNYLYSGDEGLLKRAEDLIQDTDLVIFGGAPMFNYNYQAFSERTAVTLEIAQRFGKPVIFSAIGVEGYDEKNAKCQRLKKALNLGCVKRVSTRDDFESLRKFIDNENIVIGKVSDPAVFASKVFQNYVVRRKRKKKKAGIFVLRANGFTDNGVDFSRDEALDLWEGLAEELRRRGVACEFITSGNFGDEAVLDYLVKNRGMSSRKCVFNVNTPERLIQKISSYDAVLACRLHPSIVSYSLDVPSLGLVWNPKVRHFYGSISHEERCIGTEDICPEDVAEKLIRLMEGKAGVKKDEEYLMSVYRFLFEGIREIVRSQRADVEPYSYEALMEALPGYEGTTQEEYEQKVLRKFRRVYEKYNELFDKCQKGREYALIYNSGTGTDALTWDYNESAGEIKRLDSGAVEYRLKKPVLNNGEARLVRNGFRNPGHAFLGWRMRIRENDRWYWYMRDESLKLKEDFRRGIDKSYMLKDGSVIPHIPAAVDLVVLEGVWEESLAAKVIRKLRSMK